MFSAPQLFPSWKGTFDGARPSLANLDNEHVIATLQHGLISDSELKALMHLVRSPDVCILNPSSVQTTYHGLPL